MAADDTADGAVRACPRTGRTRAAALAPGATRPSDALTVFLAAGVAWLVPAAAAGTAAAVTGDPDLRWLALHFALLGGVSQLVIGAGQFFACAFLATEPPSRATVRLELALWNVAVAATAVGVPLESTPLTGVGGTLVLAGLAVYARALVQMRRRSLQTAPWATRWYLTAAAMLAGGAALGPVMGAEVVWTHGSLLAAHLVLNVGGWFGTTIVGTLHTFYPSLTGTRLRWPRLQAPVYAAWVAGVASLAVSAAFVLDAAAMAGWALLLAATAMLCANLAASAVAGNVRSPAALLVSAAQLMLLASAVVGLRSAIASGPLAAMLGPDRAALAALLAGGWIGLTVAGSLVHLLPLMARVRRLPERAPQPAFDALPAGAGALGAAGLVLAGAGVEAGWTLAAAGGLVLVARVAILAVRAVRAARLDV